MQSQQVEAVPKNRAAVHLEWCTPEGTTAVVNEQILPVDFSREDVTAYAVFHALKESCDLAFAVRVLERLVSYGGRFQNNSKLNVYDKETMASLHKAQQDLKKSAVKNSTS